MRRSVSGVTSVVLAVAILIASSCTADEAGTAAPPEAGASQQTPVCVVEIERTGDTFSVLQTAVDGSVSGDTLLVSGSCIGEATIVRTRLVLEGVPTGERPAPTLDGSGVGRVLTVGASRVVLRGLTVTDGRARMGGGVYLHDGSWLSLNDSSSVTGNTAEFRGGGIFSYMSTVTLNDSSSVTRNTAGGFGGGIYNLGTVTLNDAASITENTVTQGGGGIYNEPDSPGPVYVCSDEVAISPNDPDDPPKVRRACP